MTLPEAWIAHRRERRAPVGWNDAVGDGFVPLTEATAPVRRRVL